MQIFVLPKFIPCLIAISLLNALSSGSAIAAETQLGVSMKSILGVKYAAFANEKDTESGIAASCVSAVVYGMRRLGYSCPYRDFRTYYNALKKQADILAVGETKISKSGLVLFNRTHFVVLSRDSNENGVVDLDDEIIHSYFEPVKRSSLSDWLLHDHNRPVYAVDLSQRPVCPSQ